MEVLVAMFVLSIGAASVLALFAAAASTHKRSVDRTHAALLAERIFSEVSGRYEPGMHAEELQEIVEDEVPGMWDPDGDQDDAELGSYRWELYLFHPGKRSKFSVKTRRGSRARDDGKEGGWSEDELFARVIIRWKQKAHARSETYHTILLPRNIAGGEPARSSGKKRSRGKLGSSPF